ncbi:hypothetical protein T10_4519 [Trichinella papuae]|uniref:Uncharacterized protein n=1 Tax=Trichinella papuae TaxID=268474 RepID=A0A0V1M698_9BILA|nr:hypothetical protein T10_4519 [Trichinella papuae]
MLLYSHILILAFILNEFAIDPTTPNAEREWKFWLMQLNDFVQLTADLGMDRLIILNLHLASFTFEYVQDCSTYDETVSKVNEVSVKPKNCSRRRPTINNCCTSLDNEEEEEEGSYRKPTGT